MTKGVLAWLGLTMMAVAAAAQTTVTSSGTTATTGNVPYVSAATGTSTTIKPSPISVLNGNVGIGTTSPSAPLEVSTITAGNPSVLKVVRTGGNVGGEGPSIEFDDFMNTVPQGHIYTSLYNIPSAANAVGKLILGSHGNAAATSSSFNDELTLFNGNVGIGITNPGTLLTFPDGLADKVQYNGNNMNQYKVGIASAVNGGDAMFKFTAGKTSAGEFGFYNAANLSMIIAKNGYVGI